MQQKHLLKNRTIEPIGFCRMRLLHFKYLYTVKKFRLDFVYIRLFKKIFRRRFIKAKTRFFKPKYWVLFLPNYTLTQKSKNARMGAGVGKFIRLTSIVKPQKAIIKTWHYTYNYLRYITNYLTMKIPNKFLVKKCYKSKNLVYLTFVSLILFIYSVEKV